MMKPIEEEYHQRKGKPIPLERNSFLKTNIDVDKEYAQIKK